MQPKGIACASRDAQLHGLRPARSRPGAGGWREGSGSQVTSSHGRGNRLTSLVKMARKRPKLRGRGQPRSGSWRGGCLPAPRKSLLLPFSPDRHRPIASYHNLAVRMPKRNRADVIVQLPSTSCCRYLCTRGEGRGKFSRSSRTGAFLSEYDGALGRTTVLTPAEGSNLDQGVIAREVRGLGATSRMQAGFSYQGYQVERAATKPSAKLLASRRCRQRFDRSGFWVPGTVRSYCATVPNPMDMMSNGETTSSSQ